MTARVIRFVTLNTTNLRQITERKVAIVGAVLINTSATVPLFVKFYDVIDNDPPTVGTTVPILTLPCPCLPASGTGTDGMASANLQPGVSVQGRLYVAVTAAAADNDTTAVAAGSIVQILVDGG